MSSNTPTQEQLRAIAEIDKSLPVTAGAGSGKTFVLTHRYFQILAEQKAALNEILTITFTEKAANQMKQKIRNLIAKCARGDSDSDFPPVRKPGLHLPDKSYWQDLLDNFEQSYISTIHGFCSRILRESAITVGLDPEFTVMDEHTTALRQPEIIRRAVFQLIYREDDAVAHWLRYYSASQVIQTMQTLVQKRTQYQGLIGFYLDDAGHPKDSAGLLHEIKQMYEQMVSPLVEQFDDHPVWREFVPLIQGMENYDAEDRFYPHYRAILELVDRLEATSEPIEQINIWIALADELKSKGSKKNWSEEFSEVKSLALDFRTEVLEPPLKGLTIFQEEDESEAIGLAQSGAKIYAYVLEKYQAWKRQQNFMDYEDLLIQAVGLLRDNDDIRREYAGQFKHILVDEFQDTNQIQYELVELLQQPENNESPKVFVVGDPKQSIYRFRGTEVGLFHQAKEQLLEEDAQLSRSFRSQPALLQWFDALFSSVMGTGSDELEIYEQQYLPLSPHRENITKSIPNVSVQIVETQSDADEDTIENRIQVEAGHIANWVSENLSEMQVEGGDGTRPAEFGDIAILFRRTTHIKQYEYALQLAGIPFYTVAGKGLFTKQEIQDIINVLRALTDPADSISVVGVLRSALFGVSDEGLYRLALGGFTHHWEDVVFGDEIDLPHGLSESDVRAIHNTRTNMQEWQADLDRLSPGRLIDRICTETGYLGVVGTGEDGLQQIRNVEQFTEFAYEYGRSQHVSVRAFVDYVATLQEESEAEEAVLYSGDHNAVQLMTIHKSKGLEFPIVIVPNIDNGGPGGMQQEFYPEYGWALSWNDPTRTADDQKVKPFLYHLVSDEEKRRELAESKRLFYVASTRAMDHLLLSGIVDGKDALSKNIQKVDYGKDHWMRWTLGTLVRNGWESGSESVQIHESEVRILYHQHTESEQLPGAADIVRRRDNEGDMASEKHENRHLSPDEIQKRWKVPKRSYQLREIKPTMLPQFTEDREKFYRTEILKIPQINDSGGAAKPISGAEYGSLAHTLLERFVNTPDSDYEKIVSSIIQGSGVQNPASVKTSLGNMLKEFAGSDLYSEISRGTARTEVNILSTIQGILLSGQIDLLIQQSGGEYIIVDYKTDSVTKDEVESKVKYYEPQLLAYAYAVYQATGIMPVRVSLYFTRLNREFTIPADQTAFRELERIVEDMSEFIHERSLQDPPLEED